MKRQSFSTFFIFMAICLLLASFSPLSAKPKDDSDNPGKSGKEKKEQKNESAKKSEDRETGKDKKDKCGPYCQHSGKKAPAIPGPTERVLKLDYRLHVSNIPRDAKSAYAWIPMPRETAYQKLTSYKVSGNWNHQIVKDKRYGNRFILVDLKSNRNKKSPNAQVMVKYNVRRLSWQPIAKCRTSYDYKESAMKQYLMPDSYMPTEGPVRNEAVRIAGGESGFGIQAKLIFDNITATVRYDGSGLNISNGDALKTLDSRTGNSADVNSLFVSEARSLNIPSTLVAGVTIPIGKSGEISVYHTWSEFFDTDLGWLPVDIANAINQKDNRESYFGGLDSNRIEFAIGRDITLPNSNSGSVINPVYPYVEVNGKNHTDIKYSISYQEIPGKGKRK